jgi:FkbM family methyltransferase
LRRSAGRKFRRSESGNQLQIETKHGFSMHLRIGDPVDTYTALHSEFEPALSNLVGKLAPDAASFIDIGCNIGYFTCLFRSRNPEAPVLAIDANPEMVARCEENLRLNSYRNVKVVNVGIAASESVIPFLINPGSPSLASFGNTPMLEKQNAAGQVTRIDVRTRPLPVVLEEAGMTTCGLIKIDIEGYEPSLFEGLDEGFHKIAERIIFEYVPGHMEACGFDPASIWKHPLISHYRAYALDTTKPEIITGIVDFSSIPNTTDTIFLVRKDLPSPV